MVSHFVLQIFENKIYNMQDRYFIAITLPDDLSKKISLVQHSLFQPGKVMQPLKPHITLLHPGMLETISPMHIVPMIKEVSSELLPIHINLEATDMFDKRALYIAAVSAELDNLYDQLVQLLPDNVRAQHTVGKNFTSHATLLQAKPKQNLDPKLVQTFKQRIDPLLPQSFTAHNLTLFKRLRPRTYKTTKI